MITTAKAVQKELSQYIKLYQSIIEFNLDKMWLEVIVKHNKKDPDQMIDDINDEVIKVCKEYLAQTPIQWVDEFGLATIVMQNYTTALSRLEEPFKVIVKETKSLVQDYLDKNKDKRATLDRIKKENEKLEKEIKKQSKKKTVTLWDKQISIQAPVIEEPEVEEPIEVPVQTPAPKKKTVRRAKNVYETAVDFTF